MNQALSEKKLFDLKKKFLNKEKLIGSESNKRFFDQIQICVQFKMMFIHIEVIHGLMRKNMLKKSFFFQFKRNIFLNVAMQIPSQYERFIA